MARRATTSRPATGSTMGSAGKKFRRRDQPFRTLFAPRSRILLFCARSRPGSTQFGHSHKLYIAPFRSSGEPGEKRCYPEKIDASSDACHARRVIMRIGRGALIVALCVSIGAHWAALQSIAWATMLVKYSQQVSLPKAVAETFDGNHPCDLCKHIDRVVHSQKKQDVQPVTIKPDLICTTRGVVLFPPWTDISFPQLRLKGSLLADSPPVPPPRSRLG